MERNINIWLPLVCPTLGNLAHNPGMYPHWELNQQPIHRPMLNPLSHTSRGLVSLSKSNEKMSLAED